MARKPEPSDKSDPQQNGKLTHRQGANPFPSVMPRLEPAPADASLLLKEKRIKQQLVIDKLPEYGTVYHACQAAGVSLTSYYTWMKSDEEFATAIHAAKKVPGHMIERVAMRRAMDARINADPLRIFMLKNLLPESYGEADKLSIDVRVEEVLVTRFVSIIQNTIPEVCPHCKTHLGLSEVLARELLRCSQIATSTPVAHADPPAQ